MAITTKSKVGSEQALPKALPRKAKSATPASGVTRGQTLRKDSKPTIVNSISDVRQASTVIQAIRQLSEDEGVTSNAIFSAAAIANTPFKATAYDNNTASFNADATQLVQGILASMDTLTDYTKKFSDKPTVRQFVEMALLDLQKTSGLGCELVLNENRLPSHLQMVSYEKIEWKADGKGARYPIQKVTGSDDIDLNIPNFWIAEINKDPTKSYSVPLLRAALNISITNHEFIEDMRRSVSRTGHSRLVVTLDATKIASTAPDDVREDSVKMLNYLEAYQSDISTSLGSLTPEDSLVVFDNTAVVVADIGGTKSDYVPLMKTLNNMQATSLKTPSSIIGLRSEGSQSLSNIEALTYLKMLIALQGPIQDVLSRALTLAVRLYGQQTYVKVEFNPINLRPEDELEAYKTMKQTRQLELLSLGIWTQQQYCHETGVPYRADMMDLSGTMFHQKGSSSVSGTDNTNGAQRTLNSDTPKKGGGKSQ